MCNRDHLYNRVSAERPIHTHPQVAAAALCDLPQLPDAMQSARRHSAQKDARRPIEALAHTQSVRDGWRGAEECRRPGFER